MGNPASEKPHMRLVQPIALLFFLQLSPVFVCSIGPELPGREHSVSRVSLMELTDETETVRGECGILLPITPGEPTLEKDRQLCFALQGFGFLTRYSRQDHTNRSPWGRSVCLLLSFCGSECHRLYGHPQETPAALNAISKAASFATGPRSNHNLELEGFSRDGNQILPTNLTTAEIESGQNSLHNKQESKIAQNVSSTTLSIDGTHPYELSETVQRFSSRASKRQHRCPKHFMSLASPRSTRKVYTMDFEAQNHGFGKFFARVALLIGAADIERVVDIERQIQKYIRSKERRPVDDFSNAVLKMQEQMDKMRKSDDNLAYQRAVILQKESLYETSYLPGQQLEIVLEPLFQNDAPKDAAGTYQYGPAAQSIQILVPSGFRAHLNPVHVTDLPTAPVRRLRGYADMESLRTSATGKTITGGVPINTPAHCRAAAEFMSMRKEVQWLQEHVYFLQHQR